MKAGLDEITSSIIDNINESVDGLNRDERAMVFLYVAKMLNAVADIDFYNSYRDSIGEVVDE